MNSSKARGIKPSKPIRTIFPYLIVLALIFWVCSAMAGPGLLFPERLPRIAIDPGHGGADTGARGPTGHLEKTVALDLARQLALMLEDKYEVILTRNDDYSVAPRERCAIANQAKADVFIGLHTGAGFLHGTNVRTVYYYSPTRSESSLPADAGGAKKHQRWDLAQTPHKDQSLSLATALNKNLDFLNDETGSKIQGAPLIVLEGADMPAVLIEVGHVTHPATEKSLLTSQTLESIAGTITQGLKDYIDASVSSGIQK